MKVKSVRVSDVSVPKAYPCRMPPYYEILVSSIKTYGILFPIVIQKNGKLMDGWLRLRIAQQLGIQNIDALECPNDLAAEVSAYLRGKETDVQCGSNLRLNSAITQAVRHP